MKISLKKPVLTMAHIVGKWRFFFVTFAGLGGQESTYLFGVFKGRGCSWGTLRIPFGKIGEPYGTLGKIR